MFTYFCCGYIFRIIFTSIHVFYQIFKIYINNKWWLISFLVNVSFISFSLILSVSNIPKYLWPASSMYIMLYPSGSLIPSVLITFLLSMTSTEYMCSLYQGVHLVLTFGKQFQVIHKQQVIQFESLASQFVASLSYSQQSSQWNNTQNKQYWR